MPLLTEAAFKQTCVPPMIRAGAGESPAFDFWPYVETIPPEDFRGYDCSEGVVHYVWRSADSRFEHVLINARESRDVFMVIVVDRVQKSVVGHRLLDLPSEYGIEGKRNH
jgi:hypothetical protein